MKPRKQLHYFKVLTLLFTFSIFLLSCEKNDSSIKIEEVTKASPSIEITLNQFKSENSTSNIYHEILPNLDISKNVLGKSKKEKITVLTNRILKTEKNNITTYSFLLEKPTSKSSAFENLFISKYEDDTFRLAIIKYNYSKSQDKPFKIRYKEIEIEDLQDFDFIKQYLGKMIDGLGIEVDDCVDVSYWCPVGGENWHGPEICGAGTGTTVYTLDFSYCFGGNSGIGGGDGGDFGGGGDDGGYDGGSNSGGGGGGGSGTESYNYGSGSVVLPPCGDEIHGCGKRADIISSDLGLTYSQRELLRTFGEEVIEDMEDFLMENDYSNESANAIGMFLDVTDNSSIFGPYNTAYYNLINPYVSADLADANLHPVWAAHFSAQCAMLKVLNPDWSNARVYWEASKEMIHIALDLGGMVPVIGEICDLANGVIYTIQGDGVNAALSFSAAIPFVGWFSTGAKYAYKAINLTNGTKTTLKWLVKADGFIDFGTSGQLRKVLEVTSSSLQAHHIVPWALRNNDIIQKAAKSKNAFHMNKALNGIPLDKTIHYGSHPSYTSRIQTKFSNFLSTNPNPSPDECYNFLVGLTDSIKTAVQNNPTTHINHLIF